MASLPSQTPQRSSSSRHESPSQADTESYQEIDSQNNVAQSTATLDSQTVLINEPSSPSTSAPVLKAQEQGDSDNEPRKCWICFSDETEDTPTSSAWKSPCPCALVAHEECLLDWIADLESPQNRNKKPQKLQCPQCKADIQVSRPRSILVSSVAVVDRIAGKLTIPGILGALGGSILSGAWFHGMASVYVVFGAVDFKRLTYLQPGQGLSPKWLLGPTVIPMALIASRTTLADGILPCLPILFFATPLPTTPYRVDTLWPPSAAMTFASLPYLRIIYNQSYKYLFAEKEKQWIRELQPQMAQDNEQQQQQQAQGNDPVPQHEHDHNHDHDHEGENVGGIQLDLEIIHEDDAGADEPAQAQERAHADEVHRIWDQAIVQADAAGNPQPQAQGANRGAGAGAGAANNNNNNNANANEGLNFIINTGRAADAIVGALCFPVIAATAGELLRAALPAALTTSSSGARRPGLLQTRWGRSVVGGCLFVAVKDTLILYSRYKLARGQRERKIVDWAQRKDKDKNKNKKTRSETGTRAGA